MEQDHLITWYLEQKEDEIETEADLLAERDLVKKVLKRLVKDNILMQVRGEGLANDEGQESEGGSRQVDQIIYVLHPNAATD